MKFEIDAKMAIQNFNQIIRKHPEVVAKGINVTLDRTKREWVRLVNEKYNLKQKVIEKFIVHRAKRDELIGLIILPQNKLINLYLFKNKKTKSGIQVEVIKGKKAILKHAFIARMPSGHQGIFQRTGEKSIPRRGRYAGRIIKRGPKKGQPLMREKIKELFGPKMTKVFSNKEVLEKLKGFTFNQLIKEVNRAIYRLKNVSGPS